jgi:hypothetical protein
VAISLENRGLSAERKNQCMSPITTPSATRVEACPIGRRDPACVHFWGFTFSAVEPTAASIETTSRPNTVDNVLDVTAPFASRLAKAARPRGFSVLASLAAPTFGFLVGPVAFPAMSRFWVFRRTEAI